jgi:hypothetical protein
MLLKGGFDWEVIEEIRDPLVLYWILLGRPSNYIST